MSSKKSKLIESAQKNLLKGQLDRAVEDYRQLIQIEPSDLRHRQKIAEILTKANQKEEAIKEYTAIAKHYIDTTHYLKAIAVYKQIQKLDPNNPEISLTLASLNEKQGLIGNATAEFASAVQIYERNGENLKALRTLESMLALDPGNSAVKLRIAEKYFSTGSKDKSFDAFVSLLEELNAREDENGFSLIADKAVNLFGAKAEKILAQITNPEGNENTGTLSVPVENQIQAEPHPESEIATFETFSEPVPVVTELSEPSEVASYEEIELIEDIVPLDDDQAQQPSPPDATDEWEEVELPAYDFGYDPGVSQQADDLLSTEENAPIDLDELELVLEIDEETPVDVVPIVENATKDEDSFDLGKELSMFADEIDFDLFNPQATDSAFDNTGSGLTRGELDNEDAESHYSLGLAYKEMGLYDEAIGEFIVASRSMDRKIDSLILQAVCLRELGNIGKAVEILSDLLNDATITVDESLGVKYELALCHEASGEVGKTKDLLAEIAAVRPKFTDVAARLKALAS